MRKTFSVKRAAIEAGVHSTEIYAAITEGKLRVVPGSRPYQILADSFEPFKRIKEAKRALRAEELELVGLKRKTRMASLESPDPA